MKKIIIISMLFIIFIHTKVLADQLATVNYVQPTNKSDLATLQFVKHSQAGETITSIINKNFMLSNALNITFSDEDGPLFNPEKFEIIVPYHFIKIVQKQFKDDHYTETGVSINDATIDVLYHTLFHEIAHAFIAMFDLPIVGKEEDAADSLATLLLIDYFEDGQEISQSAADLFDLEGNDIETFEEADFLGDHSLDIQRFYRTLCHIYGSDPTKYTLIAKDYEFTDEQKEICTSEFENVSRSWLRLLAPFSQ